MDKINLIAKSLEKSTTIDCFSMAETLYVTQSDLYKNLDILFSTNNKFLRDHKIDGLDLLSHKKTVGTSQGDFLKCTGMLKIDTYDGSYVNFEVPGQPAGSFLFKLSKDGHLTELAFRGATLEGIRSQAKQELHVDFEKETFSLKCNGVTATTVSPEISFFPLREVPSNALQSISNLRQQMKQKPRN